VWQQDLPNGRDRITLSPLEYHAYGEATSIGAIGAVRGVQLSVIAGDTPVAVSGVQVTPGLLDTLGVQPILGRGFAEDRAGPAPEAIVTAEFWRRHLGGDAGVVGRTMSVRAGFSGGPPGSPPIDGSYVIVGVLPAGVSLPYRPAEIWIPFSVSSTGAASTAPCLVVLARLRDGATLSQASADISTIRIEPPARWRTLWEPGRGSMDHRRGWLRAAGAGGGRRERTGAAGISLRSDAGCPQRVTLWVRIKGCRFPWFWGAPDIFRNTL
jgi:hypothetical protein